MYVRPKLTFVSFFMFFFAPSPNIHDGVVGRNQGTNKNGAEAIGRGMVCICI